MLPGQRIVTNAHVVADHTFVLVRKHGSPTKYKAEVQAIGHECDLALLTVESEEFWDGMGFLELGDVPCLQEAVAVVGYPQGMIIILIWMAYHFFVSQTLSDMIQPSSYLQDRKKRSKVVVGSSFEYLYLSIKGFFSSWQAEITFLLLKGLSLELSQHSMFMVLPNLWLYRLMLLSTQGTVAGLRLWVTGLLEWLSKTFQVRTTLGELS